MSYLENPTPERYIPFGDDSEGDPQFLPCDSDPDESDDTAEFENPITNNIIHAEVNLT